MKLEEELEETIANELEQMPNRFDERLQAAVLKSIASPKTTRNHRRWLGPVSVAIAGLAACCFGAFALINTHQDVHQPVAVSGDAAGETFGHKLMAQMKDVADHEERMFQVYLPTGGLPALKSPKLTGWSSSSHNFALDIADNHATHLQYHIEETPYDSSFQPSSFPEAEEMHGVTVYKDPIGATGAIYCFRMGYTIISVAVNTIASNPQPVTFPEGLLSHLTPYPSKGLGMPSSAKWIDNETVTLPFPYTDQQTQEIWRLTKDPANQPVVEFEYKGQVLLHMSASEINQKQQIQPILMAGSTYLVSHVTVNSDNTSGEVTLVKQNQ